MRSWSWRLGTSQSLDSSACDASDNTSAYSITYTDDGDSLFGSGDTISSSDTENTFDYNLEYYYNYIGLVYKVTFSSDGTGGYDITVNITPEDTASCGAGAGAGAGAGTSQSLDSSACDAFNNTSAYSITYTDDGDSLFGSGDTISSSDTENTFDYNLEYYYNYIGLVYKVTFSSDGTGGYDITVNITPEDTASCGAGAGAGAGAGTSQSLDSSACDAFNNTSAYSITYTDDGDSLFGSGDTISSSDTENTFDYNLEYYYNYIGLVYKVTFSSDGTGGYDITVNITPEDTASCGAGAGAGAGTSQSLDLSACDAFNNTSAYSITYTDDGDSLFGSGDTISSSDTENTFDYNLEYYYNYIGLVYKVTFSSDGTGGYDITVNITPEDTASCGAGAGARNFPIFRSSACDASDNTSAYSITYTDDGDSLFGTGDTISSSDTENTFDYNLEYYYNYIGLVYKVTFSSDGTGGYDITVNITPEDTASCGAGAGTGTPPEFDETPSTSSVAQTKFTLNADINEEGIIYYVVVADGALAPSSSEVRAGTGNGGTGELASGNATVDSGDYIYDFIVSGLTGGTAYDVYLVAEDNEAIPNLQAIPEKLDVTTAELISLTISGITGGDKVYDDTTAASASGTATLVGVEAGDDVILRGSPVFTFASANVGTDITITTTGYTISGTDLGNYTLTQPTLSGDITAAPLIVTAIDQTKVYGETDPSLTYTITGFVNGEDEADLDTEVSISRAVGEDVGTYTITPSAAADSNYTISFVTADFTITAAA